MASRVDPKVAQELRAAIAAMPAIESMATPAVVRVFEEERRLAEQQDRSGPALEHLLRAIMAEPSGAEILRRSGAQLETLELALARSGSRSRLPETHYRDGAVRVAQFVAFRQNREVTIGDLLHGLVRDTKSSAPILLKKHGASAVDVLRQLAHGLDKVDPKARLPLARVVRHPAVADPDPAGRYQLVLINDDFTTGSFVMHLLTSLFDKTDEEAKVLAKLT